MDHLNNLIDAYFAGAISAGEEHLLFTSLSADADARMYFKERMVINTAFKSAEDPFPSELDDSIINAVSAKQRTTMLHSFLHPGYIAAFASLIMVFALTIYMMFKVDTYKNQLDRAIFEIQDQRHTIDLLMNGLPTVQVTSQQTKSFITNN
jgi:hypothetical protein